MVPRNARSVRRVFAHKRVLLLALPVVVTALSTYSSTSSDGTGRSAAVPTKGELWFGLRVNPGLVDWFNRVACNEDTAAVTMREVALLDRITAGMREVLFTSVAEIEKEVPKFAHKIDFIGYDLEHWPLTPPEEQADPIGAMKRLRALADRHGLAVTVGPDLRFATEYGAQLARYADRFVLQLQRLQSEPVEMQNFVLSLAHQLRQANPNLKIAVQLRTDRRAEDLVDLIALFRGAIDGVSIIYNANTVYVAQELVVRLRPACSRSK